MLEQGFFAQPTLTKKTSQIDNKLDITPTSWVISLIRRKKSNNPRHTFLVVEGLDDNGLGILCRYDLIVKKSNTDFGEALIFSRDKIAPDEINEILQNFE